MDGLTPDDAKGFLAPFAAMLDENTLPGGVVPIMLKALNCLPDDERRRWLHGRRAALQIATHGGTVARSTAYYLTRLESVQYRLVEAGLVTNTEPPRDARSGRKVKTLVGELARLDYQDDTNLAGVYEQLRNEPLPVVRAIITKYRNH
jgi:hypothetical protein